jgi:hypothetical protein
MDQTGPKNFPAKHSFSPLSMSDEFHCRIYRWFCGLALWLAGGSALLAAGPGGQFIVVNLQQEEVRGEVFREIAALAANRAPDAPRIGVGIILSYFAAPREQNIERLRECFQLCEAHDLAVVVQLDGEQWWDARPDLWNWWDRDRPGFDPANAVNVEWSGWGPEHALKLAWRNWGQQIRVLPPPNLMSPRYRAACHDEMKPLIEEIVRWRETLGAEQAHLLVGVKVGWESSIGLNAFHYANGNALLAEDPGKDPVQPAQEQQLPSRGYQPIGFAAVKTAGLASSGELQNEHVTEVVRRHLSDLAATVRQQGIPREQVFVHCGGWAEDEPLYRAALNEDSCPGWSFYTHAPNPRQNQAVMRALTDSDAPYWAAVEWYPHSTRSASDWEQAIRNTLTIDRCRYVGIYNWRDVAKNPAAQDGIRASLQASP